MQRNPEQRFMGGAWVFPGGAVHYGEDADHAATAVRELEEEAGIALADGAELVPFSRWITPEGEGATSASTPGSSRRAHRTAPRRGPTAASASTRAGSPRPGRSRRTRSDELALVFPTIKHLELLSETPRSTRRSPPRASARSSPCCRRSPCATARRSVLLPGDPGYDEA